ncbi:EMILIN-2-like isoform X1 [Paramormyrops kingsleyae]|uniref:EMILIN-2-like isoform X1 n=1 Tax=Paramormyrops kingsleyae TaxID=1676925 RepID=UPI003B973B4D
MGRGVQRCTFYLMLTFSLIQATPLSYDLFQGPAYSGQGHRHKNRNWCAHVVHKNVTCAVLATAESFGEPERAACPPEEPDCLRRVMYRTQFHPVYKIGYKVVTELEWRCCPAFQGPDCKTLKTGVYRQAAPHPDSQPSPGEVHFAPRPELVESGLSSPWQGAEQVNQLEQEVQRLSQTVQDLQTTLTGLNENLRPDARGDAGRMLVTLLNDRQPAESSRDKVPDSVPTLPRASQALRGASSPEGPPRLLREASQVPQPSIPTQDDHDPLQTYIDHKFEELKQELLEEMDLKMAGLKSSYDHKIHSLEKQCAAQESNHVSLTKLVTDNEADLRTEIQDLRLSLGTTGGPTRNYGETKPSRKLDGLAELRRDVERIAEAGRALNARVDNELKHLSSMRLEDIFGPRFEELEARFNVTERNTEVHCFYIDEKLTRLITDEVKALRQSLDERLGAIELGEALQTEVSSNKRIIQGLEEKLNALGMVCSRNCGAGPEGLDAFQEQLRLCRSDVDELASEMNFSTDKLRELNALVQSQLTIAEEERQNFAGMLAGMSDLRTDVNSLRGAVAVLGQSLSEQALELQNISATCSPTDTPQPVEGMLGSQMEELRTRVEHLSGRVSSELLQCREAAEGMAKDISTADGRIGDVERACGKLEAIPDELRQLHKGLEDTVSRLQGGVHQINMTVGTQVKDLASMRNLLKNILNQPSGTNQTAPEQTASSPPKPGPEQTPRISPGAKPAPLPTSPLEPHSRLIPHIHIPLIPPPHQLPVNPLRPDRAPQRPPPPRQPMREAGEAGPPGTPPRVQPRLHAEPMQGFAGAPGYPPLKSVSFRSRFLPVTSSPRRLEVQRPIITRAVEHSGSAMPFSFSAGLGLQTRPARLGVVLFDKVLVNDGEHYNPATGTFTVPEDGRYLVSAVLMAHRGEHVEAVLTVSDGIVQRLASSEPAGRKDPRHRCGCGGSASLTLALTLRAGEPLRLVLTSGRLAAPDSNEVLSTFSAIYLYPTPISR